MNVLQVYELGLCSGGQVPLVDLVAYVQEIPFFGRVRKIAKCDLEFPHVCLCVRPSVLPSVRPSTSVCVCVCVCVSVRMELGSHCTNFPDN